MKNDGPGYSVAFDRFRRVRHRLWMWRHALPMWTRSRQSCPSCGEPRAFTRGRLWPWTRLHCARCQVSWWHLSLDAGLWEPRIWTWIEDTFNVWFRHGCKECHAIHGKHKMRCQTGRRELVCARGVERLRERRSR